MLRTNKTIEEGIEINDTTGIDVRHARFIRYCPGNGYAYNLLFTPLYGLKERTRDYIGSSDKSFLITWIDPGRSMIATSGEDCLHYSYVARKLQCDTHTAVILAEVIGHIIKRPGVTCEEFQAQEE